MAKETLNKPLVLPPLDMVEKLVDSIRKEELLVAEIKKKEELLVAEIKKKEELLLVEIEKRELFRLLVADSKKKLCFLSFVGVLLVSLWALFSAFCHGAVFADNIFGTTTTSEQQCLESKTCYVVPCEATDEAYAMAYGLACCIVLQAAAAVLAPLLTGRRRGLAFAYTAVAATTAGHCIDARILWILLAGNPGDDDRIIDARRLLWIHLAGDLLCFITLIFVGAEEEGDEE